VLQRVVVERLAVVRARVNAVQSTLERSALLAGILAGVERIAGAGKVRVRTVAKGANALAPMNAAKGESALALLAPAFVQRSARRIRTVAKGANALAPMNAAKGESALALLAPAFVQRRG
jgi:hypothetical protein